MRYVFFGTPHFAEVILDALVRANMPPLALVCNPDRPVGRKKIVTAPETKQYIERQEKKIHVLQPEKMDDRFIQQLRDLHPDLFVVAAYAKILPKAALAIPKMGTLGVHPSLLPKYRGASPIQSAILGGEEETGVTIYQVDEKTDHGPIVKSRKWKVESGKTYLQIEEELAALAGELLIEAVPRFMKGAITPQAQDETAATFTKKFKTDDGYVAPEDLEDAENGNPQKAETAFRMIRALNPEPGAWTMQNDKRVKLLEAKIAGGALKLITTQEEGQKPKALQR